MSFIFMALKCVWRIAYIAVCNIFVDLTLLFLVISITFIALFSSGNLEIICNDKYICFCDFYLQYCLIKVKFSHTDTQSNMSIFIQQNNCLMKVVCRYTSTHHSIYITV